MGSCHSICGAPPANDGDAQYLDISISEGQSPVPVLSPDTLVRDHIYIGRYQDPYLQPPAGYREHHARVCAGSAVARTVTRRTHQMGDNRAIRITADGTLQSVDQLRELLQAPASNPPARGGPAPPPRWIVYPRVKPPRPYAIYREKGLAPVLTQGHYLGADLAWTTVQSNSTSEGLWQALATGNSRDPVLIPVVPGVPFEGEYIN